MEELKSEDSLLLQNDGDSAKTTIVLGKSRSGKTYWLVKELNKLHSKTRLVHGVERPIYDKIVIFSESLNCEPFKDLNKNLPIIFIKGYIGKLVLLLKKINDITSNLFKWLVVLDDCISNSSGATLRGGTFSRQMLTYRNANISTVVAIQSCVLLNPSTRANAHRLVITGLKKKDQLRCLNEILYDEARRLYPDKKIKNEELADKFFGSIGTNILFYDNLSNKAFVIKRNSFEG